MSFFTDSVNLVLGPLQVGYSIATFLFGLATVQTYLYFQDFSGDPVAYRTIVGAIWLFELAHEVCCSHAIYFYTITSFGELAIFEEKSPKSFDLLLFYTGINFLLVFGFFSYRLWESMKQIPLSLAVGVTALGQAALYITLSAFAISANSVADFVQYRRTLLLATFFVGAGAAPFLTLILTGDLYARRQEQFYRFASLGDCLIMWIVGTGLLTSVVMITLAICFVTMDNNLIWHGVFVNVPRLLSITLLASLNARNSPHRVDITKPITLDNLGSRFRVGDSTQSNMNTLQIAIETVETSDAASIYQETVSKPDQGSDLSHSNLEKALHSSPLVLSTQQ